MYGRRKGPKLTKPKGYWKEKKGKSLQGFQGFGSDADDLECPEKAVEAAAKRAAKAPLLQAQTLAETPGILSPKSKAPSGMEEEDTVQLYESANLAIPRERPKRQAACKSKAATKMIIDVCFKDRVQVEDEINIEPIAASRKLKKVSFLEPGFVAETDTWVGGAGEDEAPEVNFSFHHLDNDEPSLPLFDNPSFQPIAFSTPVSKRVTRSVYGSDLDGNGSAFGGSNSDLEYEDLSMLQVVKTAKSRNKGSSIPAHDAEDGDVMELPPPQIAQGSRKVSTAEREKAAEVLKQKVIQARRVASVAAEPQAPLERHNKFYVQHWIVESASKRTLLEKKHTILKSSFNDYISLAAAFRAVFCCTIEPGNEPSVNFKFTSRATAKPIASAAHYGNFLSELRAAEAKSGDDPIVVFELEVRAQALRRAVAKSKSKTQSELLSATSGVRKLIAMSLYNLYFNKCEAHMNDEMCLVNKDGSHLRLTHLHLLTWSELIDKPPKYGDPTIPLPTKSIPPLSSMFATWWGPGYEKWYLDSGIQPLAAAASTSNIGKPGAGKASRTDDVLAVLGQLLGGLVAGAATSASSSQAAAGSFSPVDPCTVKYTRIEDLLAQLTAAEADQPGGRDFNKYMEKFRDEEFLNVGELRTYSAHSLKEHFGLKLGSAETLAAAILAEIKHNESSPMPPFATPLV
ncbi:hypothetical protein BKA62DRAFT_674439 [Auriculariales sp. MPI-PUGE-AT-0066]|nr:hypothetical protein BKA62DRAFT_674439 [Auriculariales sp. MPI-PUGE-AT-0066]